MTAEKLLRKDGVDGTHKAELKEPLPTAEWVFKANSCKGDYHAQMDGDRFLKWSRYS